MAQTFSIEINEQPKPENNTQTNIFVKWAAVFAAKAPRVQPIPGWHLGAGEGRKGWLARCRKIIWEHLESRKPENLVSVKWHDNIKIALRPASQTGRTLFLTGYYDPNELFFLDDFLKPGMTFIDIGANIGLYSLFAARRVMPGGKVIAIEPSSREFGDLLINLQLNNQTNVRPLKMAITDRCGEMELQVAAAETHGHNTLGSFAYDTISLDSKELVATQTIDNLVAGEGLERADVIKLDVEGAELFALEGAEQVLRRFKPLLLLELSDLTLERQGCASSQVWDLLLNSGYSPYSFDKRTGALVPARRQSYYAYENLVAIYGPPKRDASIRRP